MTITVCTDHRDALRTRIARVALCASGAAYGCFVLLVVAILGNDLDAFDELAGVAALAALTTPLLAAIGSAWGRGPCRIACTTVLAMTGPVVAIVVITALAAASH
ncbi:hypothetical protein [Tsukamurella pseudospumae]|uniref:Uncharacterized protein n=1 Tax=Tsukamurella pseudospumae TaxID=239498 RepID=A0A137ZYN9_9ACTN|nr:hypothetical protein [Tsukamurella pseudospumae]KXP03300.1 hypothetical protein AXK60_15795 [Tsukamurella pseudospumae]